MAGPSDLGFLQHSGIEARIDLRLLLSPTYERISLCSCGEVARRGGGLALIAPGRRLATTRRDCSMYALWFLLLEAALTAIRWFEVSPGPLQNKPNNPW